MIGSGETISVKRPCELLAVSRSNDYRSLRPRPVTDRVLLDAIAGIYEQHPFYGKRRVQVELSKQELEAGVRRIRHRMRKVRRGYVYLTSVVEWHSRTVLSWRLSNSPSRTLALLRGSTAGGSGALRQADHLPYGFLQGSQYTSDSFLYVLRAAEVAISMDGARMAQPCEGRAAVVAFDEVRECVPARLERSEGGPSGDRSVVGWILQPGVTASGIGVPNTRRCLLARPGALRNVA